MARRNQKELLKTEPENLPVKLTQDEIRERGERLAAKEGELESHIQRAKQVKADLTANEKRLEADIQSLSLQIRDKSELRQIPCDHIADYKRGVVRVVRQDTEQVVRERAIEESEKQRRLDGVDGDPAEGSDS